eukprot:6180055-Pleurochrysis_carterae.AAC.1
MLDATSRHPCRVVHACAHAREPRPRWEAGPHIARFGGLFGKMPYDHVAMAFDADKQWETRQSLRDVTARGSSCLYVPVAKAAEQNSICAPSDSLQTWPCLNSNQGSRAVHLSVLYFGSYE